MKPRAPKLLTAICLCGALSLWPGVARAQDAKETPVAEASPSGRKAKKPRDPSEPARTPKPRKAKDIHFPVPKGEPATDIKVPEYSLEGQLLKQLMAAKATNIDDEHIQMEKMRIDLNKPDGSEDFHIEMPTSTLNLKTNVITTEQAVSIQTKDFDLYGEKMKFDTVERSGELVGRVHMVVRNAKPISLPAAADGTKPE